MDLARASLLLLAPVHPTKLVLHWGVGGDRFFFISNVDSRIPAQKSESGVNKAFTPKPDPPPPHTHQNQEPKNVWFGDAFLLEVEQTHFPLAAHGWLPMWESPSSRGQMIPSSGVYACSTVAPGSTAYSHKNTSKPWHWIALAQHCQKKKKTAAREPASKHALEESEVQASQHPARLGQKTASPKAARVCST